MRTSVVLPAPFGPSSARTFPSETLRSTPARAHIDPKRLPIASTSIIATLTSSPKRSQTISSGPSCRRGTARGARIGADAGDELVRSRDEGLFGDGWPSDPVCSKEACCVSSEVPSNDVPEGGAEEQTVWLYQPASASTVSVEVAEGQQPAGRKGLLEGSDELGVDPGHRVAQVERRVSDKDALHESLKLADPSLGESGFDFGEGSFGALGERNPRRRTRDRDGEDQSDDLIGVEMRRDHHRRCLEVHPTAWPRHAVDFEAAVTEVVDIALDRPSRHSQLAGEISEGPVASATKQPQDGVPSLERAHALDATADR